MFSIEQLHRIRAAELEVIVARFPPGAHVLELGAGTGAQARALTERGFEVTAVDLADSNYAADKVFPVRTYNGRDLPFAESSFDIVFSSNVLEHVGDLPPLHEELKRVLKPGGACVHVLPTDAWRLWTTLSAFPAALQHLIGLAPDVLPREISRTEVRRLLSVAHRAIAFATIPIRQTRHGERGNLLTEQYYFRPAWWRRHFLKNGFVIGYDAPIGIFYTGHMVLNGLSLDQRRSMANTLGSACHLFEMSPA